MKARPKTLLDKPRGGAWPSSARGVNCPVKSGKIGELKMRKMVFDENMAYLLGMYYGRGTEKGIGIKTKSKDLQSSFLNHALKMGISPEKITVTEDSIFFFHSRLKVRFEKMIKERLAVFKRMNTKTLAFIAGLTAVCGKIKEKSIIFSGINETDALLFERLGFRTTWRKGKLIILDASEIIEPISLI